RQAFAGVSGVRMVAYDRKTQRVVCAVAGALRVFDPARRQFETLPPDTPPITSGALTTPGNGAVYYGSDNALVALHLAGGGATRLADLPAAISELPAGPKGDLYVSSGVDIYRVKN